MWVIFKHIETGLTNKELFSLLLEMCVRLICISRSLIKGLQKVTKRRATMYIDFRLI